MTEIERAKADLEWWRQLARELEMMVYGFSYRDCATFMDGDGKLVELPKPLVKALRKRLGI